MNASISGSKELASEKHVQYLHATFRPKDNVLQIDKCMDPVVFASLYHCLEKLYTEAMAALTIEEQLAVQAGVKGIVLHEED